MPKRKYARQEADSEGDMKQKGHKRKGSVPSPGSPGYDHTSTPTPPVALAEEEALSPKSRGTRKESEQKRRVMMNQYFEELIVLLSMVSERNIPKKMDKATTLHEAVRCLRIYDHLTHPSTIKEEPRGETDGAQTTITTFKPSFLTNGEVLNYFLDAHDMFLNIVSETGRILYSSELITSLLGYMQSRLIGQNMFEYIHEDNKEELLSLFKPKDEEIGCRISSTSVVAFPTRTFHCHLKMYTGETSCFPQYLPFICRSFLRMWDENDNQPPSPGDSECETPPTATSTDQQSCVLLLAKLPTALTMVDLPIGTNEVAFNFEMRISREGTIMGVDKHAIFVSGFTESELVGSSFFDYVDPYHVLEVGEAMSGFLKMGLGTTTPYRIRTKGDRYLWLISKGYLSHNPWNHKPDHVLLSNRVLGCDQVLPEHRFFRSRKLLPDVEGDEYYVPPPLNSPPAVAALPEARPTKSFPPPPAAPTRVLSEQRPPPSLPPPSPKTVIPAVSTAPPFMPPPTPLTLPSPSVPPPYPSLVPTLLHQHPPREMEGLPSMLAMQQQELDRKNQMIFELQRQLLEQQHLMEKERTQFYQVTQQVIRRLGNPAESSVQPGMQAGTPTKDSMAAPRHSPLPARALSVDGSYKSGQSQTSFPQVVFPQLSAAACEAPPTSHPPSSMAPSLWGLEPYQTQTDIFHASQASSVPTHLQPLTAQLASQAHPSLSSITAQAHPSLSYLTAQAHPSLSSLTPAPQTHPSHPPPLTAQAHPSLSSLTPQTHPSHPPPFTAQAHPSHPPFTAQAHPSHPPLTAQAHPSHPPLTPQTHPSHPPLAAQAHPSLPPFTAQAHPSRPPLTAQAHPSLPPFTAQAHPSLSSSLSSLLQGANTNLSPSLPSHPLPFGSNTPTTHPFGLQRTANRSAALMGLVASPQTRPPQSTPPPLNVYQHLQVHQAAAPTPTSELMSFDHVHMDRTGPPPVTTTSSPVSQGVDSEALLPSVTEEELQSLLLSVKAGLPTMASSFFAPYTTTQ